MKGLGIGAALFVTASMAHAQQPARGALYDNCLTSNWVAEADGRQYLVFQNNCGQPINFVVCYKDGSLPCFSYDLSVAAQQRVGISDLDYTAHGGTTSFACGAGYISVGPDGRTSWGKDVSHACELFENPF